MLGYVAISVVARKISGDSNQVRVMLQRKVLDLSDCATGPAWALIGLGRAFGLVNTLYTVYIDLALTHM